MPGGRARIDRLLGSPQSGAAGLERSENVLEIGDRTREPIKASDHQHVALADEIQNGGATALRRGAALAVLIRADTC